LARRSNLSSLWGMLHLLGVWGIPYAFGLLMAVGDSFASSVGVAYALKAIFDSALEKSYSMVLQASKLLLLVAASEAAFSSLGRLIVNHSAQRACERLRDRIFSRYSSAAMSYMDEARPGDLVARLVTDVENIAEGLNMFYGTAGMLYMAVISVTGLLVWEWRMAITALGLAVLCFFSGACFAGPLKAASDRYQSLLGRMSAFASSLFGGFAVVKSLQVEDTLQAKFSVVADEHFEEGMRRANYLAVQTAATSSVPWVAFACMIGVSGLLVVRGRISPGDAVGLVQLGTRSLFPVAGIGSTWAYLQQHLASVDRVREALGVPGEEADHGTGEGVAARRPGVYRETRVPAFQTTDTSSPDVPALEFRDVTFSYREKTVFTGFSLKVPSGAKIVLTGPSGSGKTTFLRLLVRLYEPASGQILLFGKDVRQMDLGELRRTVALVPQEPYVLPVSVRENIALGWPCSDQEVVSAARAACAHDFIMALPKGYDTVLGSEGKGLSGGERQRLCLARAFLRKAKVILLDEPTSSVDGESERLIWQAIESLPPDITVITVTHTPAGAAGKVVSFEQYRQGGNSDT
jgi:ABC-type multidrug transport system fused ATPase/permease subunit